ncbi:MAG TPA: DUF1003 domain-containing protein [Pyrinomonadaceae bacterium]|jgi:uncharacterized membrane protein
MSENLKSAVSEILGSSEVRLTQREKRVLESILKQTIITRDTQRDFCDDRTFGERVADKVAIFGGSWMFIISFGAALLIWVVLNSFILSARGESFDPYPYILLNLFLSMLAAIQAPIIMMSQNRQAEKDRLQATHDYEVNLKAELEIRRLHEKVDELREKKWIELLEIQQQQILILEQLLQKETADKTS